MYRCPSPLSPSLSRVLEATIALATDSDDALGRHLYLSPRTVHCYWGRICHVLGARNRLEAVLIALESRLVSLERDRERERERERLGARIAYDCKLDRQSKHCYAYAMAVCGEDAMSFVDVD